MGRVSTLPDDHPQLFAPGEIPTKSDPIAQPAFKTFDNPVWTENKAQFIMRYLRYFVYVTHHGTYIDGFAGPQEESESECWAAKLVLASEPRWLRHFYLCDIKRAQIAFLKKLKESQPEIDGSSRKLNRDIKIYQGNFNKRVDDILSENEITEKEATFCLLDQRTFECEWETVRKLATFKRSGNKIELFYFLANSWLDRALSAQKDLDKLTKWWGRDDWADLKAMSRDERKDILVSRIRKELEYKSVVAWPIFERNDGSGAIMYYMIHATDHKEGPPLMARAYKNAVYALEPAEQLKFALLEEGVDIASDAE